LVDGYEADKEAILELSSEELPKELQGKTDEQKRKFIEAKAAERTDVQKQIRELSDKQTAYVTEERKKLAETKTLDTVMVRAVRKQATENGFKY